MVVAPSKFDLLQLQSRVSRCDSRLKWVGVYIHCRFILTKLVVCMPLGELVTQESTSVRICKNCI